MAGWRYGTESDEQLRQAGYHLEYVAKTDADRRATIKVMGDTGVLDIIMKKKGLHTEFWTKKATYIAPERQAFAQAFFGEVGMSKSGKIALGAGAFGIFIFIIYLLTRKRK